MSRLNLCDDCPERAQCFYLLDKAESEVSDEILSSSIDLAKAILEKGSQTCSGPSFGEIEAEHIRQLYGNGCGNPYRKAAEQVLTATLSISESAAV